MNDSLAYLARALCLWPMYNAKYLIKMDVFSIYTSNIFKMTKRASSKKRLRVIMSSSYNFPLEV